MSSYLCRCNLRALRSSQAGLARASIRFSSSKKSDSKTEDVPPTAPPKKQPLAKASSENANPKSDPSLKASKAGAKPKRLSQNYIAFKDLPKPSQEFQEMSTEQFNASLHMTELPEEGLPTHEPQMPFSGFKYDFTLNPKHLLPARRGPALTGARPKRQTVDIEPNLALLGISLDPDTLASGLEEHPLRESITGMCVMNPLLKEIKNKSLWEFFPGNKKYGASPFGDGAGLNSFKDWEESKNAKLKVFEEKKQKEEREFRDFCKNLQESNSFVRKAAPEKAEAKTQKAKSASPAKATDGASGPVETSGRRKLDRALLRQYRKYRKEQYLKDSKDDKEE